MMMHIIPCTIRNIHGFNNFINRVKNKVKISKTSCTSIEVLKSTYLLNQILQQLQKCVTSYAHEQKLVIMMLVITLFFPTFIIMSFNPFVSHFVVSSFPLHHHLTSVVAPYYHLTYTEPLIFGQSKKLIMMNREYLFPIYLLPQHNFSFKKCVPKIKQKNRCPSLLFPYQVCTLV